MSKWQHILRARSDPFRLGFRVLAQLGVWGNSGVMQRLYSNYGKEHGNYYLGFWALGDSTTISESQMEKDMQDEMEPWVI